MVNRRCISHLLPTLSATEALRGLVSRFVVVLLALLGLSVDAAAHGTFHDLMQSIDQEIAVRPQDASLVLRRADIYLEHNEWQPCLVEVEKVERMAPGQFPTDLTRGRALAIAGQWQLSKMALDDFLALHPDHPVGLLERARAWSALKDDAACLIDYKKALATLPHREPDLFHEVAQAMWLRGAKEEAVDVLNQGLKEFGQVPQLVNKALEYEVAIRRYDDALVRVDVMQRAMPRPEPWMARRASLLAQAGRLAESRNAWQSLIQHISSLPNLDRGSNAMCLLMEQAHTALAALASLSLSHAESHPARP